MMRSAVLLNLFFVFASLCSAQTVQHTIYLFGDGGKDTVPGPALQMLQNELDTDSLATVIFLGDNIYPNGLVGTEGQKKRVIAEKKLNVQLEATGQHQGYVFWIPGNHDWKAGRWKGPEVLSEQEKYVEKFYAERNTVANDSGTVFLPKGGMPGPELLRVSKGGYNIIFADIQWWLQRQFFHPVPKRKNETKKQVESRFLHQLDSLLEVCKTEEATTILALHHPMYSNGHHGAHKQPWRFIMNWIPPFPLLGLVGLNRALVQDISQPRYKRIRNKILAVLEKFENVIIVSGHEHTLQYFHKNGNHFLVSGAGSKTSNLKGDRYGAEFVDDRNFGFMKLEILESGSVRCAAFGHTTNGVFHEFTLY